MNEIKFSDDIYVYKWIYLPADNSMQRDERFSYQYISSLQTRLLTPSEPLLSVGIMKGTIPERLKSNTKEYKYQIFKNISEIIGIAFTNTRFRILKQKKLHIMTSAASNDKHCTFSWGETIGDRYCF